MSTGSKLTALIGGSLVHRVLGPKVTCGLLVHLELSWLGFVAWGPLVLLGSLGAFVDCVLGDEALLQSLTRWHDS